MNTLRYFLFVLWPSFQNCFPSTIAEWCHVWFLFGFLSAVAQRLGDDLSYGWFQLLLWFLISIFDLLAGMLERVYLLKPSPSLVYGTF